MIKSPLRYPGGKSRAVEIIAKLLPDFDEFREPFLGGGSVFVYVKQRYPNKKFWVNDLYSELYKFWLMAQEDVDALIEKVNKWRKQYLIGKELFISNYISRNIQIQNEQLQLFN
jgi:DNA adenine methylase